LQVVFNSRFTPKGAALAHLSRQKPAICISLYVRSGVQGIIGELLTVELWIVGLFFVALHLPAAQRRYDRDACAFPFVFLLRPLCMASIP
jgi:hypothetical protein